MSWIWTIVVEDLQMKFKNNKAVVLGVHRQDLVMMDLLCELTHRKLGLAINPQSRDPVITTLTGLSTANIDAHIKHAWEQAGFSSKVTTTKVRHMFPTMAHNHRV